MSRFADIELNGFFYTFSPFWLKTIGNRTRKPQWPMMTTATHWRDMRMSSARPTFPDFNDGCAIFSQHSRSLSLSPVVFAIDPINLNLRLGWKSWKFFSSSHRLMIVLCRFFSAHGFIVQCEKYVNSVLVFFVCRKPQKSIRNGKTQIKDWRTH